jgi:hypothetical protein
VSARCPGLALRQFPLGSAAPLALTTWRGIRATSAPSGVFPGRRITAQLSPAIEDRTSAIAGALIRNFINGRVMILNQLLDATHEGQIPMRRLLVPNFFVEHTSYSGWQIAVLLDALLHLLGLQARALRRRHENATAEAHDPALRRHVETHYQQIKV